MSKLGSILWLVSGLSLLGLVTGRYILGGWTTDLLFIPLGLFVVSFAAAMVTDYKFYLEFMTLKTTKHGMNMGVLIMLVMVTLVGVNYFGKKFNKTWDFTEEKLHTLADQTQSILSGLSDDLNILVFYRGEKDSQAKQQVKQTFSLFTEFTNKVKLRFVDAYVENEMAEQYLKGQSDADQVIVFVEHQGKKVRVESPINEQNITPAIIKATRAGQKTVYFMHGHGERDINSEEQEGLAQFKSQLEDASFIVKELNFFAAQKIPDDADIVAVVGPKYQLVEGVQEALVDFARRGGRLFIAADPGEKHQIALLSKRLGVEYKNNYILDIGMNRLLGRGLAGILGLVFDSANAITKKFINREGFTIFDRVSEVVPATGDLEGVTATELVKSAGTSFIVNELKDIKRPTKQESYPLAVLVEGKLPSDKSAEGKDGKSEKDGDASENGKEFAAVFFGDSDFVSQKDISIGLNSDLALNTIAYLAKEADLVSIKPKAPKGTELSLTSVRGNIIVASGVGIPFLFFIFSGVMWYRRRGA